MPTTTGKATEFIQFTRASNATVTDSDGKVKWAPHNLLTNSESFDASAWVKTRSTITANATAAPNGTITADKIVEDTSSATDHRIQQTVSVQGSVTISAFMKAAERTWGYLRIDDASSSLYAFFDLSTGSLGTVNAGLVASIIPVGGGWYLCSAVFASPSVTNSGVAVIGPSTSGSTANYTGNGTSGIFVWGAHLYRSDLGGMQANTSAYPMYNPTTPKNLLGNTENFNAWTKLNVTITSDVVVAPNGLQVADKVVASTATGYHTIAQGLTFTAARYVFSFYAKAAEYTLVRVADGSANRYYLSYDLASGSVVAGSTGGSKYISSSITSVGDGWYRCSVTFENIAATGSPGIIGYTTGATLDAYGANYTGDGTSGVYIWGAQLSDSASLDSYVPVYGAAVTSAAYYGPRRDFDSAGVCKGLLVEEQRSNLAVQSGAFDSGSWSKSNSTVTANAATSPSGDNTADKLIEDTATGLHLVSQGISLTAVSYTFSCYAKAAERTWFSLATNSVANVSAFFNLANGTIGTVGSSCTATISTLGNGWYRCAITFTAAAGTNNMHCRVSTADNVSSYTGDGTSGIYIWGAQLEAGSFATSYIPTGAATATRNADVASVSTQAFPYSATEGALVVSADTYNVGSTAGSLATLSSGASANSIIVGIFTNKTSLGVNVGGVAQAFVQPSGSISTDTVFKAGGAFASNSFIAASNGTLSTEDTAGSLPSTPTTLSIGGIGSGSSNLNGHIRQITYLPRRISSTELQTRTQ